MKTFEEFRKGDIILITSAKEVWVSNIDELQLIVVISTDTGMVLDSFEMAEKPRDVADALQSAADMFAEQAEERLTKAMEGL